ncbi:MAG: LPS export ABC transporter permease LptG [Candidatus Protistobacter heckmanni]|nr:LPS export ABC transporter permease LptG [Candidatus Protistobacter heckmanni]
MAGPIYQRYFARQIYLTCIFVLLALVGLFVFFDMLNAMGEVGKAHYSVLVATAYVLLQTPGRFYEILPLATLIGSIYVFAQMAANSEFTIFRVAGLPTGQALTRVLKIGLPLVLATYLVGEFIGPYASELGERLKLQALGQTVSAGFRSGVWVKDKVTTGVRDTAAPQSKSAAGEAPYTRFVNVVSLDPDRSIHGVRIFEFAPNFHLRTLVDAKKGVYLDNGQWELSGAIITHFEETPNPDPLMPIHRVKVNHLGSLRIDSELNPQILEVLLVLPERMALIDLFSYVRHLRENKQDTKRYDIALWKKLIYPLTVLVMMALALPFAYMHARAGTIGIKVFGGIMLGMSFNLVYNLFSHLGLINEWPAPFTAIVPGLIYLALALLGLRWVERH